MVSPRLASRYAKSLMDIAVERAEVEPVYNDVLFFQQLIRGNRDFVNLLRSPVIKSDVKNKIVNAITAGRVGVLTNSFIKLLISKSRENVLPQIIDAFIDQYKRLKNIHTVKLTTATEVSEEVKNRIVNQVKATSNMANIELETKVDESIIGGFVLQTGDKLIDASIAYDLREIRKQFENNDFVYKVR